MNGGVAYCGNPIQSIDWQFLLNANLTCERRVLLDRAPRELAGRLLVLLLETVGPRATC